MAALGFVALPQNDSDVPPTQPFYPTGGGANGTVALPNRVAADAVPAPKYAAGARGQVRLFQPSVSRNNPFKQYSGLTGWWAEFRAKFFQPNSVGLEKFVPPASGEPDWTTNRTRQSLPPKSDIRLDARYRNYTLREEFDTRLNAIYWPNEAIQRFLTKQTMVKSQTTMVPSFFNRLTQYRQATAYSQLTQVLGDNP